MKKGSLVVFLVLLAIGGVWKWAAPTPPPGIRLVGFRSGENGPVAVIEIVNESDRPFSYPAYAIPLYRTSGPAGWQPVLPMSCHMQETLLPHSSKKIAFQAPVSAFQVGIPFTPGTAEDLYAKPTPVQAWLNAFTFRARVALGLPTGMGGPFNGQEPVWSNTFQDTPSPAPRAELMACHLEPIRR